MTALAFHPGGALDAGCQLASRYVDRDQVTPDLPDSWEVACEYRT